MIHKIVFSLLFVCLLLALSLHLLGVEEVSISGPFLSLMKNTSRELNDFRIAIPDIPHIPNLPREFAEQGNILEVLSTILDVIVNFINGLVNILNFIIMVFNTLIQLIEFLIILLKNIIIFRDELVNSATLVH